MSQLVPQALCSIADVKLRLQAAQSSDKDPLIADLINSFSVSVEKWCNRGFEIKERVEYFDAYPSRGPGDQPDLLYLSGAPIDDSAEVKLYADQSRAWAESSKLVANTDFNVDYNMGEIAMLIPVWDIYVSRGLKCVSTGGLVRPRAVGPAVPTLTTSGTGLTGSFKWKISTITTSTSEETLPSASASYSPTNQGIRLDFANPGASKQTLIYRTKAGGTVYYYVGVVSGSSGGAQYFLDTTLDAALDISRTAPEEGPVQVPADLKGACVTQVVHEFRNAQDPGMERFQRAGAGAITYQSNRAWLPQVELVLREYRRQVG